MIAIAHPMQALVKYHGLRDWRLRIPYHDSISVNMDALWTETSVEFAEEDRAVINGETVAGKQFERILAVVNKVRGLAGVKEKISIVSENSVKYSEAKGLGFSSSAGAALAAALFKLIKLDKKFGWNLREISKIARLFSGSACRSAVGGYAIWHAGGDDTSSYAERIADEPEMGIVIVPLQSDGRTEEAHLDVESSPFFDARIRSASKRVKEMRKAIKTKDLKRVMELAEIDSLELHALTMTGRRGLVAYKPESIQIMGEIRRMREEGTEAYFSMQTGPSVFVNTYPEDVKKVRRRIGELELKTIVSSVGGEVRIV
ncbi:MAG: diphosphomevalonate decarboxylase [Candidatus Hydrothermarchaeaceae archaeon]